VVLACVAGSVDALSVFGLGGVFTSLLSGNTIVLAAYLVQGHSTKALLGIFVFVGYIPGAALAALFLKQEKHNSADSLGVVTRSIKNLSLSFSLNGLPAPTSLFLFLSERRFFHVHDIRLLYRTLICENKYFQTLTEFRSSSQARTVGSAKHWGVPCHSNATLVPAITPIFGVLSR
jgi:hypothetical protein